MGADVYAASHIMVSDREQTVQVTLDIETGPAKIRPGTAGDFPHISSGPEAGEAMPAQGPHG